MTILRTLVVWASLCTLAVAQTTIRRVTVFPSGNSVQVEISASAPVIPQTQVVVNPDRLIIDFPNSVPGTTLHNVTINRGQIKGLRVGLFTRHPPVTRVVVDLAAPQPYEIVPTGSTIVLRLNASGNQLAVAGPPAATPPAATAPVTQPAVVTPPPPPPPRMSVDFKNGKLKIFSDRASLAEVLGEVHRRTGADITIPPSASQEQVFGTLGPASPREVMSALLNGSHFNFVVVGADNDPSQLRSVLLTPRDGSQVAVPAIAEPQPAAVAEPQPDPTAAAPEPENPPVDETPSADLAPDPAANTGDSDNPQAEPDMSPRRRHRRASAGDQADQPDQPEPPQ